MDLKLTRISDELFYSIQLTELVNNWFEVRHQRDIRCVSLYYFNIIRDFVYNSDISLYYFYIVIDFVYMCRQLEPPACFFLFSFGRCVVVSTFLGSCPIGWKISDVMSLLLLESASSSLLGISLPREFNLHGQSSSRCMRCWFGDNKLLVSLLNKGLLVKWNYLGNFN